MWDVLLESTKSSDFLTLLPSTLKSHFKSDAFVEKEVDDSIYWKCVICYPKKNNYSTIEEFTLHQLLQVKMI